jgi:hypothetical protein
VCFGLPNIRAGTPRDDHGPRKGKLSEMVRLNPIRGASLNRPSPKVLTTTVGSPQKAEDHCGKIEKRLDLREGMSLVHSFVVV